MAALGARWCESQHVHKPVSLLRRLVRDILGRPQEKGTLEHPWPRAQGFVFACGVVMRLHWVSGGLAKEHIGMVLRASQITR